MAAAGPRAARLQAALALAGPGRGPGLVRPPPAAPRAPPSHARHCSDSQRRRGAVSVRAGGDNGAVAPRRSGLAIDLTGASRPGG